MNKSQLRSYKAFYKNPELYSFLRRVMYNEKGIKDAYVSTNIEAMLRNILFYMKNVTKDESQFYYYTAYSLRDIRYVYHKYRSYLIQRLKRIETNSSVKR